MTEVKLTDLLAHRRLIGDRIDAAVGRAVASGRWINGPEVRRLEVELASFAGVRHAIACSNGTDALKLGLLALGMRPGDAVMCPSFTFTASAEAIALLGGVPVFVDCEPDGFNLSVASVAAATTAARRAGLHVVGVVAVDLFGLPADHAALRRLCDAEGLWVLDDAAQALGATVDGRQVVTSTPVATTSFFPAKPLGCYGDGGAVFTDDDELAAVVRSLVAHGRGGAKYDNVRVGMNARLDTLQAAVLLEKLPLFERELEARRRIAAAYAQRLSGVVRTPVVPHGHHPTWAQYTVRVPRRDEVRERLASLGIETAVHYPRPLHRQAAYVTGAGARLVDLSVSEQLAAEVLSLPVHPYLTANEVDAVVDAVARACRQPSPTVAAS